MTDDKVESFKRLDASNLLGVYCFNDDEFTKFKDDLRSTGTTLAFGSSSYDRVGPRISELLAIPELAVHEETRNWNMCIGERCTRLSVVTHIPVNEDDLDSRVGLRFIAYNTHKHGFVNGLKSIVGKNPDRWYTAVTSTKEDSCLSGVQDMLASYAANKISVDDYNSAVLR